MADTELELDIKLIDGPVDYQPPPFRDFGGGENAFLGRTRTEDHPENGKLTSLRYEAKESMALKVLEELAREAAQKYNLSFVRIIHSLGDVPVSKASVLVQVISPHRKETFEATAEIMDRLKKKVPIWKQEIWERGETWKDGAVVDPKA
mmetsp:Transcript_34434/g.53745  ORF Transcript_34434/g.53745 Transcript_34434/m.53745 type:complete len:149 (-) Transcript_34434:1233-1679(-)